MLLSSPREDRQEQDQRKEGRGYSVNLKANQVVFYFGVTTSKRNSDVFRRIFGWNWIEEDSGTLHSEDICQVNKVGDLIAQFKAKQPI